MFVFYHLFGITGAFWCDAVQQAAITGPGIGLGRLSPRGRDPTDLPTPPKHFYPPPSMLTTRWFVDQPSLAYNHCNARPSVKKGMSQPYGTSAKGVFFLFLKLSLDILCECGGIRESTLSFPLIIWLNCWNRIPSGQKKALYSQLDQPDENSVSLEILFQQPGDIMATIPSSPACTAPRVLCLIKERDISIKGLSVLAFWKVKYGRLFVNVGWCFFEPHLLARVQPGSDAPGSQRWKP